MAKVPNLRPAGSRPPPPPAPPPPRSPNELVITLGEVNDKAPEAPRLDVEMVDDLIRHWRGIHDAPKTAEGSLLAAAYVDAYQTIRRNHGLGQLP